MAHALDRCLELRRFQFRLLGCKSLYHLGRKVWEPAKIEGLRHAPFYPIPADKPNKTTPKQVPESSRRSGCRDPLRHHTTPIQPFKQRLELCPRQPHRAILHLRPGEVAQFQNLVDHHHASLAPWPLEPVARPWLTQTRIFSRSPRLDRKTTVSPERGSSFNALCTSSAKAFVGKTVPRTVF